MKATRILKSFLKWTAYAVLFVIFAVAILLLVGYWRSSNDFNRLTTAPGGEKMKAIVYADYGGPEVLQLKEIPRPVPTDNQLLVKVHASSVNPYDWHFMRGTPYIMRPAVGLRKPKNIRLGVDFAGTVTAVGRKVTKFKPGDEVFGGKTGAFAEYLCVSEGSVARKPANVSFEQAGSVQIAGITALQAVRDKAGARPGRKILINGASGGVGTFAVQIAKSLGAEVTGVCSTKNLAMVRALGADHVIDYTKEDFTKGGERYDVIIDNVGNQPVLSFTHALVPKGKYIMIGGGGVEDQGLLGPMSRPLEAMLLAPFVGREMSMMMADPTAADLTALADLMEGGKVKPVIDRTYPLSQVPEAIRYLEKGHARGKVVITIE